MKWKLTSDLNEGDTRTRNKFAWFPTLVYRDNECYKVWLETYRVTEQYQKAWVSSDGYYYCKAKWKVTKREPLYGEHE